MRGIDENILKQYQSAWSADLIAGIPAIVFFELHYGIAKSDHQVIARARLDGFMARGLAVLPLSAPDAQAAGEIRARLNRGKNPIGPFDTLIAGQALAPGLTLVTANVREFSRVAGLLWVDWATP
jgi:tRNA(fMet)-specific endonuclease VapC